MTAFAILSSYRFRTAPDAPKAEATETSSDVAGEASDSWNVGVDHDEGAFGTDPKSKSECAHPCPSPPPSEPSSCVPSMPFIGADGGGIGLDRSLGLRRNGYGIVVGCVSLVCWVCCLVVVAVVLDVNGRWCGGGGVGLWLVN